MPEYLAPAVYVEEVDSAARPIEGVSTSTAGMVGVAERGPVNVPMFVSSFDEYRRIFGGHLEAAVYGENAFLPYAVDGFFSEGGKRLFVTRVAADQAPNVATRASVTLMDRGERAGVGAGVGDQVLLADARSQHRWVLVEQTGAFASGNRIRLGDGADVEYGVLAAANAVIAADTRFTGLRTPLARPQDAGTGVTPVTIGPPVAANQYSSTLADAAPAGSREITVAARTANLVNGILVRFGAGNAVSYGRVASVPPDPAALTVTLEDPLSRSLASGTAVTRVEPSQPQTTRTLTESAAAGDALLMLNNVGGVTVNTDVRIDTAASADVEYHRVAGLLPLSLRDPAAFDHGLDTPVQQVTLNASAGNNALATTLAVDAPAGARVLALADRGTLAAGEHLRIGAGAAMEFATIATVPAERQDRTIRLVQPLARAHASTDPVVRAARVVQAGTTTSLIQSLVHGERIAFTAEAVPANVILEIGTAGSSTVEFRVTGAAVTDALLLANPLVRDHARGSLLARRDPLVLLEALDVGPWGNELRVTAEDDAPLLETQVAAATGGGLPVPLLSAVGVEVGTVLEIGATAGVPGRLAKVSARQGNLVTLTPTPGPLAAGTAVRTREFRLTIAWVRNGRDVMPSETFSGLSLDPRHSRYVEAVLGSTTGPLRPEDRRPEGESVFVRADDQAVNTADAIARIRLGPDVLVEETPLGERRAAARGLAGGTDSPAGIAAATFVGTDSVEPQLRTGLFTLRNEELISLVAVPGRSDPDVQMQVIAHCQQMRYRFAVLDSVPGSDPRRGAGLDEVRAQRNRYDTRYAAFYYPWVIVRDVRPPEGRPAQELAIPPSGHVLGVYADTDVRRGVHKAPANVVLDSVLRLQRRLTKAEHDLLNPSPVNINVLRDFRDVSRGLRVYGARCITSDTNWKYVNVRRLFLFLEQSLDIGTQYVVFEPNDAPLWARVRQSIATFLTRVWRDGALMGATPEEAFFVRCDRTTMTQDDIDNGRLIILIGVAPVKPAEFVIVRIGQWAGGSAVQEL